MTEKMKHTYDSVVKPFNNHVEKAEKEKLINPKKSGSGLTAQPDGDTKFKGKKSVKQLGSPFKADNQDRFSYLPQQQIQDIKNR